MVKTKGRAQARGGFPRLNLSSGTRAAFGELLRDAPKLGVDPDRVEAAGLPGLRALLALKQAAESRAGRKRDALLAQLQGTMGVLQYRKHPELVQQLQARAMALQGRGGDTEVAHVTVGEIVLPRALQTRAVIEALGRAAGDAGIPLNRLRVGSGRNSVNPRTGQPEFFANSVENSPGAPPPPQPSSEAPIEEITVTAPREAEGGQSPQKDNDLGGVLAGLSRSDLEKLKYALNNASMATQAFAVPLGALVVVLSPSLATATFMAGSVALLSIGFQYLSSEIDRYLTR